MAEVYIDITTKYNYITQFAQIAQTLPGGIWIMKQACTELLQEYDRHRQVLKSEKLIFNGVTKQDVYNIAAPLLEGEEWIIPARVEPRSSENSQVMFFRQHEDKWMLATDLPQFNLQDPFWTHIHDELVFGGVEIFPHPMITDALSWRTKFYRGANLSNLEYFASGPDGMKDIRLAELPDGSIAVFTRPQGEVGGRGTIGYTQIASLNELTPQTIMDATLLEQFVPEEWGGANEVHLLADGALGVVGHIAHFDQSGARHYYGMTFVFDPIQRQASPMQIIGTRSDFPSGASKRPDLQDVLFSGGLMRLKDGTAWLYAGLSDAEAGRILIPDPFGNR